MSNLRLHALNLVEIPVAAISATALFYATQYVKVLMPICLLAFVCLYTAVRFRKPLFDSVILGTMSTGITIFIYVITAIIAIPLEALCFLLLDDTVIRETVIAIILSALQVLAPFILFKIKRFRSGISLRKNSGNIELLLLASILSIFLMTLIYTDNVEQSIIEVALIFAAFCGLTFIVWWKKHITYNYQKQLYTRNEAIYEEYVASYESENKELKKQNEELSRIIHRDNKLVTAMSVAVRELLAKSDDPGMKGLLTQLEELSSEHKEIIESYRTSNDDLPKTDNIALDAVIHFIHTKAQKAGVRDGFSIPEGSLEKLYKKLENVTDLNTIVCDLGDNAVIATARKENGKIYVRFDGSEEGAPFVSFYDNGDLFDEKVISGMGRKRTTTHAGEGGSGIGLMTMFGILRKYNASFLLNEKPDNPEYTKEIRITFDGLNNVGVVTERKNIEKICKMRTDFFTKLN